MGHAAGLAEAWRRRERLPLPYSELMPRDLRAFFLPEMRSWLVRAAHAADEIAAVGSSHEGEQAERMVAGIQAHHERLRASNPRWLYGLLHQLPAATRHDDSYGAAAGATPPMASRAGHAYAAVASSLTSSATPMGPGGAEVHIEELQTLIYRNCPWWL